MIDTKVRCPYFRPESFGKNFVIDHVTHNLDGLDWTSFKHLVYGVDE